MNKTNNDAKSMQYVNRQVTKIQACFRGHLARRYARLLIQTRAALIIQQQYREYRANKKPTPQQQQNNWQYSIADHEECKTRISVLEGQVSELRGHVDQLEQQKQAHEKAIRYLFQQVESLVKQNQLMKQQQCATPTMNNAHNIDLMSQSQQNNSSNLGGLAPLSSDEEAQARAFGQQSQQRYNTEGSLD